MIQACNPNYGGIEQWLKREATITLEERLETKEIQVEQSKHPLLVKAENLEIIVLSLPPIPFFKANLLPLSLKTDENLLMDEPADKVRWGLEYNIGVAVRYHMRRQAYFERWHRMTGILSLVGGSAAFASMAQPGIAKWFAAVIAVSQAIDLMVDTRKFAQLHDDLRRNYSELWSKLIPRNLKMKDLEKINQEVKHLEAKEPPLKRYLIDICQNETLDAIGITNEGGAAISFSKVGFWKKLLRHWV